MEPKVVAAPVLCTECSDVALCAAVKRVPRTDMVMIPPRGARKTGGRAKFRARGSSSLDDRAHSDLSWKRWRFGRSVGLRPWKCAKRAGGI